MEKINFKLSVKNYRGARRNTARLSYRIAKKVELDG